MDINSEIERISTNIASAYTACSNKGATMPATQNLDNLPNCVASIQTPAIGINREVVNGVYKAPTSSFTFSLPSTAISISDYTMYYAFRNSTGLTSVDLSSLTTVSGSGAMEYAFYGCTNLTSLDLSNLTTVRGYEAMEYAFYNCTGLTGTLDLSSLTTIGGEVRTFASTFSGCTGLTSVDLSSLSIVNYMGMEYTFQNCTGLTGALDLSNLTTVGEYGMSSTFKGCTGLTSVDLSSLTTVSTSAMSYAFQSCTGLTSVNFANLQTIGTNTSSTNRSQFMNCFLNCNNLTSLTFPNLEKIYCTGAPSGSYKYSTFENNNKVQKMYFPKLDTITYGTGASSSNQESCKWIFYGCSSLTELHFAAANQAAIEASPGYPTAWGRGAGNVTIYFDLVETVTLTVNVYTGYIRGFILDDVTYLPSDFTNNSLTVEIPKNTDVTYRVDYTKNSVLVLQPDSGTINTDVPYTLNIENVMTS